MAADLPIYMDHQATTPCDPRVLAQMVPWFTERFGNAASRTHRYGWEAEEAVEAARGQVAALVGATSPRELVLTSGATEANNLALKGVLEAMAGQGKRHLVTAVTEHASVRDTARYLEATGKAEVSWLPVGAEGRVDPEAVASAIRDDTALVSVMHANNEIGTVSDLAAIGAACRARGVYLHTDAVQSVGKIPFDVEAMQVDLASVSAHKLYGPKGVGALYVRRRGPRVRLAIQMHGGGHERGRRSGTLPVPLIVGFGVAADLAAAARETEAARLTRQRDRLLAVIQAGVEGVRVNGSLAHRLPGNLNLAFEHTDAEALILALRGVAVSAGSACTSATPEPSHVLRALGLPDALVTASLRFGLGRGTTDDEVEAVGRMVVDAVATVRARSTRYGLA